MGCLSRLFQGVSSDEIRSNSCGQVRSALLQGAASGQTKNSEYKGIKV